MDSLNAQWLKIELDSIDEAARGWSEAVRISYEASVATLVQELARRPPVSEDENLSD